MQLPVQHRTLGTKAPAALAAQKPRASRRAKAARLTPSATAVVDKPSTSNGASNGHAAYGNGAYANGNSTNGAAGSEGPVILNGQVLVLARKLSACAVTPAQPPVWLQILHNVSKEKLELVGSIDEVLAKSILPILKDTATIWQPADFLPDPTSDTFIDEARLLLDCRGCSGASRRASHQH